MTHNNNPNLDPRVNYPDIDPADIPQAEVVLIAPLPRRRKYGAAYTWQVIRCPYCGRKHSHGAGTDPATVDTFLGHRVAHCHAGGLHGGGYYLVKAAGGDS